MDRTTTVHRVVNINGGLVYVNDRVNGYRNGDLLYVSGGSDGGSDEEETSPSRNTVINTNKTENTIQRRINKEGITKNLESRPKRIPRSTDMGAVITTQYGRRNK